MRPNNSAHGVEPVSQALQDWTSQDAVVEIYSASMQQLEVRLYGRFEGIGQTEYLQVRCVGCEYLSGPTAWSQPQLKIRLGAQTRLVVFDDTIGFTAECARVALFQNGEIFIAET